MHTETLGSAHARDDNHCGYNNWLSGGVVIGGFVLELLALALSEAKEVDTEAFKGWRESYEISIAFPIQSVDLFDHSITISAMTRRFTCGIIKGP